MVIAISREIESGCVDCGLPCLGHSCQYYGVEVAYCDNCGEEADYEIDDGDYCENCAETVLQECFDDLSQQEKADCLNVYFKKIYD